MNETDIETRTVKDVVEDLLELTDAESIIDAETKNPIDYHDLQQLFINPVHELVSILGMEELYYEGNKEG